MNVQNISNQNGRAFEYAIVFKLFNSMPIEQVFVTSQTIKDQLRDKINFENLDNNVQNDFVQSSKMVFNWLREKFDIINNEILIHRLTDQDARKGDVSDIRITLKNQSDFIINLSIKHNHNALKHQRPPTAAIWCGFEAGNDEDNYYRSEYNEITSNFLIRAKTDDPSAINFRDLKEIDPDYINNYLYSPVCDCVARFINTKCKQEKNVVALFFFLVGNREYYKIINMEKYVRILRFNDIEYPIAVNAKRKKSNYIILNFSNGWDLSLRLHTATSKISTSLKFDTQPLNLEQIIFYDDIPKS